jgi:anion-transporting  ArsA/GET3 family ATPase
MIQIEEVLKYLNADRVVDMTPEMHACSLMQSQNAIRQTMETILRRSSACSA